MTSFLVALRGNSSGRLDGNYFMLDWCGDG